MLVIVEFGDCQPASITRTGRYDKFGGDLVFWRGRRGIGNIGAMWARRIVLEPTRANILLVFLFVLRQFPQGIFPVYSLILVNALMVAGFLPCQPVRH